MAKTKNGYILKQDVLRFIEAGTLTEWTGGKKAIGLTPGVAGNDSIWQELIKTAVELVKAYSRHWYDMNAETAEFYAYDNAEAYTAGDRLTGTISGDTYPLYLCILDAPAGTALTNTTYYTEIDDRNPVIVEIVVIFIIYALSRKHNPRQIPEQRQIDYDNAMEQLKDIQRGRIQLEIKERVIADDDINADPGQEISFGDFEDQTNDVY